MFCFGWKISKRDNLKDLSADGRILKKLDVRLKIWSALMNKVNKPWSFIAENVFAISVHDRVGCH